MTPPARDSRRMHRAALAAALAIAILAAAPGARAEPRRFALQPEASEVSFAATSRLMNAEGRFHRLSGEVVVDPADMATARVSLSIETASIDTGIGMRDNHLRSADFLDVQRFPAITFESTRVEATGRRATITGRLTIKGVTHEVAVPVDVALSPTALVATGELVVNRGDYAITYNSFLNPIGNEVRVSFTFRARAS